MTRGALPKAPLVPGAVLIASPHMLDPNFMHSVVLLCSVGTEGAMGFVLNHPTGFCAGDLMGRYEDLEHCELDVFAGGPVGRDQLHFLHATPDAILGGQRLTEGLFLGGEFEDLRSVLRAHGTPGEVSRRSGQLKLFVGYSGWGAGQLEAELDQDSWLVVSGNARLPFECAAESREGFWRQLLSSQGPAGKLLASLPPDPSWN